MNTRGSQLAQNIVEDDPKAKDGSTLLSIRSVPDESTLLDPGWHEKQLESKNKIREQNTTGVGLPENALDNTESKHITEHSPIISGVNDQMTSRAPLKRRASWEDRGGKKYRPDEPHIQEELDGQDHQPDVEKDSAKENSSILHAENTVREQDERHNNLKTQTNELLADILELPVKPATPDDRADDRSENSADQLPQSEKAAERTTVAEVAGEQEVNENSKSEAESPGKSSFIQCPAHVAVELDLLLLTLVQDVYLKRMAKKLRAKRAANMANAWTPPKRIPPTVPPSMKLDQQ